MEFPVSGLHRLFHTTPSPLSAHSSRTPTSLESVTEDAHTSDLLYPEPSTLRQTQHHAYPLKNGDPSSAALAATSHDDWGGLDIQSSHDVRIIVAQDGNLLAQQPRVLYDSQPPPPMPVPRQALPAEASEVEEHPGDAQAFRRRNTGLQTSPTFSKARHERSSSFTPVARAVTTSPISPVSPESDYRGAFSNPKLRKTTLRPASSGGESTQSRDTRERREETEALLGCMFGSTGLPLVSSTKLHIKPAGSTTIGASRATGSGALETATTSGIPRRRTPLTRSTTLEELQSYPPPGLLSGNKQATLSNNSSVLVTRIFTVNPTNSMPRSDSMNEADQLKSKLSVPIENDTLQHLSVLTAETEKAKQVRTPTYAVGIVLQLPSERHHFGTPSLHDTGLSSPGQDRVSQSPKQMGRPLWEDSSYVALTNDIDRDVENVIDHWNVLNRVAYSLEIIAQGKIQDLLVDIEANQARLPAQIPPRVVDMQSYSRERKLKQPSRRTIQLPPGALQQCDLIRKEAEMARKRVALALKTRKVIAGQGRWGIWREEARWIERWAGRREQNFFFFNLLTAFLGTHTEWLDMLGPSWYRHRHTKGAQSSRRDVNIIQHRTVVVSTDKMAAKRLIFLLSAFLPSTFVVPLHEEGIRPHSPWSNVGYSQSPPSGISVLRQQSLRRTINRRQRGNRATPNVKPHTRGVSFSAQDMTFTQDLNGQDPSNKQHGRRASDVRSIRSLPLPISSSESTRKSSSTTTGTVVQDTAVPVPHFANLSPDSLLGTSAEARPGSSGSFASLSLKHTLTRSDATDSSHPSTDSHSMSRWGSMISGFWSIRRGSSTDASDAPSSQEGLGISGIPRERRGSRPMGKLSQMVEEVDKSESMLRTWENAKTLQKAQGPTSVPSLPDGSNLMPEHSTPAKNIPERPKPEQFPMKLSIDESTGAVEVDLPMVNSFSSSFASSMSSPKATHTGASSFNDSSLYGRSSSHEGFPLATESATDVAGWLKAYHPDFALQAVRPYSELKDDIKRSMRSEPIQTPPTTRDPGSNPWTDVCTTLIADAQTFSVTRLTLRRRPAAISTSSPATNSPMEETISSEPIMDLDATLIDAVERVLAQSSHSSRAHSRTVSPSRHDDGPTLEVPKSKCKKLVLGALEQVARSVEEERTGRGRVIGAGSEREQSAGVVVDSTLREGVKRWLRGAVEGV